MRESPPAAWIALLPVIALWAACGGAPREGVQELDAAEQARVTAEVEAAVWAFHAADTARNAEAVIRLLWPEFSILVDGTRLSHDQVVAGSREFLAGLDLFHTEWQDLRITPLGPGTAVASFSFRDSIVTKAGGLIRSKGPTTFVWQRRGDEWRLLFADADHYPIGP